MLQTTIACVLIGRVAPLGPEASAIRKRPQEGRVPVGPAGLRGDEHAYRSHGGPDKAVLHYAFEHYAVWSAEFPRAAGHLARPGAFGENLSSVGMSEAEVCVGDTFRAGTAVLQVSQPRQPCWKLGYLAAAPRIPHRMQENGWTGWYYRVLEPGMVGAGDRIKLAERAREAWTIERLVRDFYARPLDRDLLEQIRELPALSAGWRKLAEDRLRSGRIEPWAGRLEAPPDAAG
jgi:MOSC domain-containing protein YiiM